MSEILPKDGYNLVIESATLSVFEENTNLLPFSNNKIVECYVVDYGTLTADAYAKSPAFDCGVLTSSGANVLKEYSLNVIGGIVEFLATNPAATKYQFRLQFLPEGNVSATSTSAQAMWSVFSGDETKLTNYRPKLVIKYHHQKK